MRLAVLVVLVACGRVDFALAPRGDGGAVDASTDGAGVPDRVMFLPFNNTLDDPSGRLGTCIGTCPTYVPGHDGSGIHFNGSSCVTYPDIAAYDTAEFTIAVWADAAALKHGTFVGKTYDGNTGIDDSWEVWMNDGIGALAFSTDPAATGNEYLDVTPPAGTGWHFIVATYDGTTKRLFVDGAPVGSHAKVPTVFSADPIRLGCDWDHGAITGAVTGAIDDVSIYTRALSAAEIATLATL